MKLILIAFILIFSLASCEVIEIKKPLARTVAPEDLALELEFYATCQEFKDRILPSVWISKHDLCLPIQFNVTNNPDVDDLRTHYFCTNIDHGRSIVHFVEIYETDETIQFPNFVLSFVPTNPFRILTKRTTVSRRPNCFITNDYCSPVNAIVNSCKTNPVVYKRGFVITHDRIYITANQQESRDCRTSVTECCAYVAPLTLGGICENVASTDLLKLPKKHKYDDDKKHHGNNHHDNDHHDNNHHDNDHHDNDHHDNDHHDNDHHDNDHHGKPHGKPQHGKPQHGKPQHDNDHDDHDEHDNDHGNNHHWNNNHGGKPQHGKEESAEKDQEENDDEKK